MLQEDRNKTDSTRSLDGMNETVIDTGARKQKLSCSDDFAQVKFQKLNDEAEEMLDSLPTDESALHCPSNEAFGFLPPNVDDECSIWEQRDEYGGDLTLDPFLLYEAVINKRCSPLSSSDAENDPNDRTVVERYGNAETVLVEVHATQDSSSEEDHFSPTLLHSDRDEVFFASAEEENRLNETVPDDSSSPVEVQDCRLDFSDEEFEPHPAVGSSLVFYDESESKVNVLPIEVAEVENVEVLDHGIVKLDSKKIELLDVEKVEDVDTKSKEISDTYCNTETLDSSPIILSPVKMDDHIASNLDDTPKDLKIAKKPCDLRLDISQSEDSNLDDLDPTQSFNINSPPSPVYPPKSLKTHEFQSLRTKIDKLPLHKKKQIVIPSPSSPVEEVRKKFELQASNSRKTAESPTTEIKYRSHSKDLTPKLVKAYETVELAQEGGVPKPDAGLSIKNESMVTKRHSEPPPKTTGASPPSEMVKRISNKYESSCPKTVHNSSFEKLNTKPKTSPQPSLFTQLKIRKLQSLQVESSSVSEPVDPWSDPILDMQEDYHPIMSYLPSPTSDKDIDIKSDSSGDKPVDISCDSLLSTEELARQDSVDCPVNVKEVENDSKSDVDDNASRRKSEQIVVQEGKSESSAVSVTESQQSNSKLSESTPESEAVKRERINRIKEERRAQLREKLKQESFRMEAEEKEKVQTKFRLRKDCSKHSLSFDAFDENVRKSDKAVETDSAKITETGTHCDLNISSESNKYQTSTTSDSKSTNRSNVEQESKSSKCVSPQISGDFVLLQNKSNSGKKSIRSSYEDSRKWLSMPPTDIRDKVAMFERSKDANDLCRLGPNGKFPQKQSPSALASSFVR